MIFNILCVEKVYKTTKRELQGQRLWKKERKKQFLRIAFQKQFGFHLSPIDYERQ